MGACLFGKRPRCVLPQVLGPYMSSPSCILTSSLGLTPFHELIPDGGWGVPACASSGKGLAATRAEDMGRRELGVLGSFYEAFHHFRLASAPSYFLLHYFLLHFLIFCYISSSLSHSCFSFAHSLIHSIGPCSRLCPLLEIDR